MAVAALAALVIVPAACGGDDDEAGNRDTVAVRPAPAPTVPDSPLGPPPPVTEDERAPSEVDVDPRPGDRRPDAPDDPDDAAADDPQSPAPAPSDGSALAVRRAVSETLATSGLRGARVTVSGGASTVRVELPRARACGSSASPERLAASIRSLDPAIRTVRITVAGTGQALGAYRRARCENGSGTPADGGAGAAYYKRGRGPFTSPAFAISSRRFTVTYRNESDFFQAFVMRSGRSEPSVLSSLRPGSGSGAFRGPGRFRLKINASGRWTVTVRDGG